MKNILIVSAAAALLLLGWFLLSDLGRVETEATGDSEKIDVGAEQRSVGEEQHAAGSKRELVKSPESGGSARADVSAPEKVVDPARGTLLLKVVYAKGRKPAPFVRLLLLRRGMVWDAQETHRTGKDGTVRIENLQPGSVFVKVLRGGEKQFKVFAGQTKRGTLAIPSGVGVAIEVVDADGVPVANAKVWLSERWRDNRGAIAAETDREGKAMLENVSPECNLAVRCRGFEPSYLQPIRAERATYSHRQTDGTWSPGAPPISRVTGKDGRFAAHVAPQGKLVLQVRHPDFAPYRGEVGVAEYADGEFHSGVLAAGTYIFQALGDRFWALDTKVTVAEGSTTTESLRVRPAALRTLQFVIPEGVTPPRFMQVSVRSTKGKFAGYFSISPTSGMTGNVSLLLGQYVVRVLGPHATPILSAKLTVDTLTYTLHH